MANFTTRFDDTLLTTIDDLAAAHKISRNALLEHLAHRAVQQGFLPTLPDEGYRAVSPSGGILTLVRGEALVMVAYRQLTAAERTISDEAYRRADDDQWYGAKMWLIDHQFVVTNITRQE